VDWSPSYYILAVLAAGAVVIALVMGAAKLRLRPLSFAMIGLAVVAGGLAYVQYHDAMLGTDTQGQSSTGVRSKQPAGESMAGRNENGMGQTEDARAPNIVKTEIPVRVSDEQRAKIRDYLAQHSGAKVDQVDFSLVIGGSVPRQARLSDLPDPVADLLQGYKGDQYLLVRDQMVIVDVQSRRIVALIPGMG
jgi:Protein of unknown function (DUF1236)